MSRSRVRRVIIKRVRANGKKDRSVNLRRRCRFHCAHTHFGENRKQLFLKSRTGCNAYYVATHGQIRGGRFRIVKSLVPRLCGQNSSYTFNVCVYIMHSLPAIIITAYTVVYIYTCAQARPHLMTRR